MRVQDVLLSASEQGVYFYLKENDLVLRARKNALSAELKEQIRQYKSQIIEYLESAGDRRPAVVLPPLLPTSRNQSLPLSSAQQRLWFIDQLGEGSAQYNLSHRFFLRGEFQEDAFRDALQDLLARHEVLRTRFVAQDGEPRQVIAEHYPLPFERHDLTPLAGEEKAAAMQGLIEQQSQRPFDLQADLMLRVAWLQLDEGLHLIACTMHHIVSDAWSGGIFQRELSALYAARCRGEPHRLPPLPIQYADYAAWQRQWLAGPVLQQAVSYWKQQLAGVPAVHALPLDKPRPAEQRHRGRTHRLSLGPKLTAGIAELNRQHNTTLFMFMHTALALFLGRCSGERDIVVGSAITGRTHRDVEGLIGFFINDLVLRLRIDGTPGFTELLKQHRETILDAYAHQHIPFEMLVEELNPERSMSYSPLYQIKLDLQGSEDAKPSLVDLELLDARVDPAVPDSRQSEHEHTVRHDLYVNVAEQPQGLSMSWAYNSDLFSPATIARWSAQFETLLEGIVAEPTQSVFRLPLLTPSQRQQLLRAGLGPQVTWPQGKCIHQLFEAQVERSPDAAAVVAGDDTLTYRQLNAQANQLAHYLLKQGAGPGSRIALCAERSIDMVVGLLGVLKTGGAYLPLDPAHPPARLEYMLQDSGCQWLLTQGELMSAVSPGERRVLPIDAQLRASLLKDYPQSNPWLEGAGLTARQLAYVIYTSGSTGRPKGVMVEHEGVVRYCDHARTRYYGTELAGSLVATSYGFDLTVPALYVPLLAGGHLRLLAEGRELEEMAEILLGATRPYLLRVTPSHLAAILPTLAGKYSPCAHALVIGGEALPVAVVDALRACLPNARLYNHYGPTESIVGCSLMPLTEDTRQSWAQAVGSCPIGTALGHKQLRVLNTEMQLQPVGTSGQLYVGGEALARGYLGQPSLTAQKFICDPFSDIAGARLYATGDRVRWRADGILEFLGRVDHQVKIRGLRIELGEIEQALLAVPGMRECAVRVSGVAEQQRLVAYVVPEEDPARDAEDDAAVVQRKARLIDAYRENLGTRLPAYMIPQIYVFLPRLPLTLNGKLDRDALPEPDEADLVKSRYVAPRDVTEQRLCALWQEVLKVDRVGTEDDFFQLGGHSLMATRLMNLIRREFSTELPLRALFEAPTVSALAATLREAPAGFTLPPVTPVPRDQPLPLSYAQQRLWFIDQLGEGSAQFNIADRYFLQGEFREEAFTRALRTLIDRHEALRTNFKLVNGEARQVILQEYQLPFTRDDLSTLSDAAKQAEAQRLIQEEAARPFDLGADLMLRVRWLKLAREQHLILYTTHHIASDGWSKEILQNELSALYEAYRNDQPNPLQPQKFQYADFAVWQRNWLQGEVLEKQLDYWRGQLTGIPLLHALPLDYPRPARQTFAGVRLHRLIGKGLTERIRALCEAREVTLFMFLQTAFALLLGRYSNATDIVMGSPVASRSHKDVEGVIGFFINTLVLRTDLSGNPAFGELLEANKEMILDAFANQHIPFEMLVDELNPERSLSHDPLTQIMFVLQNNEKGRFGEETVPTPRGATAESAATQSGNGNARVDLELQVSEFSEGLSLGWQYNKALFRGETIARLADSFEVLLGSILATTEKGIERQKGSAPRRAERIDVNHHQVVVPALAAEQSIEPRPPGTPLAASAVQRHWWYLGRRKDSARGNGNMTRSWRLQGALDVAALRGSLQQLVARHESLRTHFEQRGGSLVQVVSPPHLPVLGEEAVASARELAAIQGAEQRLAFDLSRAHLWRIRLLKEADGSYVLVLTLHRSIADELSAEIFIHQLAELYRRFQRGHAPAADPALQYGDFAHAQQRWLDEGKLTQQWVYWRTQLADLPMLKLPAGRASGGASDAGARRTRVLPGGLSARVRSLAWNHGVSFQTALLSVFGVLLSIYSRQYLFAIATRTSNRRARGIRELIAPLANTLLLRMDLRGDPRLADVMTNAHETAALAEINQDLPFEKLCESHHVHCPVSFALRNPRLPMPLQGLAITPANEDVRFDEPTRCEQDLSIVVTESRAGAAATVEYRTDLFDSSFIERLLCNYERFLGRLVADPETRLSDLELIESQAWDLDVLGRAEELRLLRMDPDPRVDSASARSVLERFRQSVEARPNALAVAQGEHQLSYAELDRRSTLLARFLVRHGVGPEVRVGVCLDRSVDSIVCLLATWKAGGCYLALDPDLPAERLRFMVEDAEPALLLTRSDLQRALPEHVAPLVLLDAARNEIASCAEASPVAHETSSGELACVVYAPDPTGQPVGTMVEHAEVCDLPSWQELLAALCSGACVPLASILRDDATGTTGRSGHSAASGTRTYVLDQRLRPVPFGVAGEICVAGAGVRRGYLNRPALTAERFVPDPFAEEAGARMFRTGEQGRWREPGTLEMLDRAEHPETLRTARREPAEIERTLRGHEDVGAAVVVPLESVQGRPRLAAYVVEKAPGTLPRQSFIAKLKARLRERSSSRWLPHEWIVLESMPVTAQGKLDRKALPPPGDGELQASRYVAPGNPTEEKLCALWQKLLQVPRVGVEDNFFQLGGHSLLVSRLLNMIRQEFAVELPLRALFEAPTVAALSGRLIEETGTIALPPLTVAPRDQPLPLSYAQQRLWFIDQLEEGSTQYNMLASQLLEGTFDLHAFEQALRDLLDRHEILRTHFVAEDGEPRQVIAERYPLPLQMHDLSLLNVREVAQEANRLMREEAHTPFDLGRDLMLRVRVLKLSAIHHVVLYTMHHIASDGWSQGIFKKELGALYGAYSSGKANPLAPLPFQYADYALWQRRWLQGAVLEKQMSYWQQQLQDLPPLLTLQTDRPRPAVQTHHGSKERFELPLALTKGLQALSRENGVTPFMTLLSAFAVLLGRHAGQQDVAVGTPIANRRRGETEGMIGLLLNTLVMRTDLRGDPPFADLLKRTREMALQAYAHQDVPFEQLVEKLNPERSLGHSPLFQVMFILQNMPLEVLELPGLAIAKGRADSAGRGAEDAQERMAHFDLTLSMEETPQGLSGVLVYNTDLFERTTIRRMLDHYVRLLDGIVEAPHTQLSQLPMLGENERRQQLQEWNATDRDFPYRGIHELFETQAAETPERIALVYRGDQLTYSELNRRANRLAHRLIERGVGSGTRVGLCIPRSPEMVIGLLAILKAGAAYVPLDPDYPQKRLEYVVKDSGLALVVGDASQWQFLDATQRPQCLPVAGENSVDSNPGVRPPAAAPAYVIYTSGSTGKPKGVKISHGNALNLLLGMQEKSGVGRRDRLLAVTTLSFDIALLELYLPLTVGGTVDIAPAASVADGERLMERLEQSRITVLQATPVTWKLLLDSGWQGQRGLSALVGGEAFPRELAARLTSKVGSLVNVYGPTETTVWSTRLEVTQAPYTPTVPIGRPIANTQVYVLDEQQRLLPTGAVGRLYLGGAGVAQGYVNRPGLTAEKFLPHPFSDEPGARIYFTGDLARWLADGTLEYLGRVDHQVKVRGFRIELGEIENALLGHEGVRDAVVVAREIAGEPRLAAYVVAQSDTGTDEVALLQQLRARLHEQLPAYMVPSAWMVLASLPLTANGKVDRQALPPPETQDLPAQRYAAPRNATEEKMCGLWQSVLKVGRVGIEDDFFLLGGHSLLAARLVNLIRQEFAAELPLRALFEAPTVAALCGRLGDASGAPALAPLTAAPRDRPLPLSFAQQRLWFIDQLGEGSTQYNLSGTYLLQGDLDVAAFEQALQSLLQRHEVLRTNFADEDGEPRQVIAQRYALPLQLHDLSGLSDPALEREAARLMREEARTPFDLGRDLMLRVRVLKVTPQHHLVLYTMHHIACDAWSMGIFRRELGALYAAYSRGGENPLPPLPLQYADYATWQRQWLQGEVLEQQLSYWRAQLQGLPPLLTLPTDRARPAQQSFRGDTERFALPFSLSQRLHSLGGEQGVTLYMTLLSAFAVLLGRYSGQRDVAIGTPIANRRRQETEALIGFFVNTLVMRNDLGGDPTCVDLLKRTREMSLGAFAHQDIPFEQLVEQLNPQRSLSHAPLFQVMFILQNAPTEALELSGLQVNPPGVPAAASRREDRHPGAQEGTARFDLTLSVQESAAGLAGVLEYNTDLFDRGTIRRMLDHYARLLEAMVSAPQSRLSQLPMLTPAERQQQLLQWNATERAGPQERCIHELFEQRAALRPDAVALVYERYSLTCGELDRRANGLANRLIERGVGPEVRVGLCMSRTPEMVVGLLAILKAGGCYVPLDPELPRRRLDYLLEDARIALVVTGPEAAERVRGAGRELLFVDPAEASEGLAEAARRPCPDHPAYLIYTSASTGSPKGVLGLHRSIVNRVNWLADSVGSDEVLCQKTSLGFVDHVAEIFQALAAGVPLVLIASARLLVPRELLRELDARRVTRLTLVPSLLKAVLESSYGQSARWLRYIHSSGEALHTANLEQFKDCFPRARLFNIYGSTEMGADVTSQEVAIESLEAGHGGQWVPIGRGIDNTRSYILDADGQLAVSGAIGELHVGGACLARGYFGRPGLTAEKFVPSPFARTPGGRLYRTGDLARWCPDGSLEYVGRADTQVKVRGFRIELAEIESALLAHEAVRDVAVVAREDAGEMRLFGYVVADAGDDMQAVAGLSLVNELRAHLHERLPGYMVPSALVLLERLPRTATGKLDRNALPVQNLPSQTEYLPPEGPTEQRLAELWSALLKRERVGRHDNFFELGGNSLMTVRLVRLIRQEFGTELPVQVMFESPTIAALAAMLGTDAMGFAGTAGEEYVTGSL